MAFINLEMNSAMLYLKIWADAEIKQNFQNY